MRVLFCSKSVFGDGIGKAFASKVLRPQAGHLPVLYHTWYVCSTIDRACFYRAPVFFVPLYIGYKPGYRRSILFYGVYMPWTIVGYCRIALYLGGARRPRAAAERSVPAYLAYVLAWCCVRVPCVAGAYSAHAPFECSRCAKPATCSRTSFCLQGVCESGDFRQ